MADPGTGSLPDARRRTQRQSTRMINNIIWIIFEENLGD
jgi:hypothetical protein